MLKSGKKSGVSCNRQSGFTLIELLVVIAVIAVLVSMLLPALQGARAQAKVVVCAVQLKNMGVIWLSYAEDFRDVLPPSPTGGTWNYVWPELHDEIDRYDTDDGKIFYCTDHTKGKNADGTEMDWYTPIKQADYFGSYQTGYALFTNVLYTPNSPPGGTSPPYYVKNTPWRNSDGVSPAWLSWQYAWTAAEEKLRNIIPAAKVSERSHIVQTTTKSIIPDETPMVFDETYYYLGEMRKEWTRHFSSARAAPYAINAVYLDGHIYGRKENEIGFLRNYGSDNGHAF